MMVLVVAGELVPFLCFACLLAWLVGWFWGELVGPGPVASRLSWRQRSICPRQLVLREYLRKSSGTHWDFWWILYPSADFW